jgi:hypothetical protein
VERFSGFGQNAPRREPQLVELVYHDRQGTDRLTGWGRSCSASSSPSVLA